MVSTNALDLIYNSVNAFFGGCQDNLLCNCFVKSTCGLPCPHEVAEYTRFGSHIPLDRVHAYWRKLDILPIKSFDNDIEEELRNRYKECWDTINERFEEAPRLGKNLIVRRLTEICHPETLMVNEPEVKTNNKGRPKATKAQILHSTKRNPSAFEYENVIHNQVIFNQTSTKLQPVRRKTQVAKQLRYLDQIPLNMRDSVENTVDVDGDGNCGFRSIAVGLGQGTDAWPRIRVMIWQEMFNHKPLYGKLLMSNDRVDKVLDRIGWYNGPCGEAHWFDAPEMGYAVASAFNVVLVTLSPRMSLVFLPLSKPIPSNPKIVCVAHVNGNHYINVTLKDNCQLPPLAYKWHKYHDFDVSGWLDYVIERLPIVPQSTTMTLDDE